MTYKTPDVYVEEISTFPRSVAEVASAVPAFVGYTERTKSLLLAEDLKLVPTVIRSIPDFEEKFGKGPPLLVNQVNIDDGYKFKDCDIANQYYLYDSIRLHFDNGGGKCYVVSTGTYPAAALKADLIAGVDQVATKDEPTMLVIPDAAAMGDDDLAQVQQRALNQCGDLKDRVAILDTRRSDPYGEKFRDKIGINNLKYGAAYTPWLEVSYDRTVAYPDVKGKIFQNGAPKALADLTASPDILTLLNNRDSIEVDITRINADVLALVGAGKSISSKFGELVSTYAGAKTEANLQNMAGYLLQLASLIDGWIGAAGLTNPDLKSHAQFYTLNTLQPVYLETMQLEAELKARLAALANPAVYNPKLRTPPPALPTAAEWGSPQTIFAAALPAPAQPFLPAVPNTEAALLGEAEALVASAFSVISGTIDLVASGAAETRDSLESALMQSFGVYANIIKGVKSSLAEVPPSGAMAGVYCRVDNDKGVWKAPANVSLTSVDSPTTSFTRDETDDLNVDVVAGKSINAIREFIGRGTLVWGARTLAGNDNEWRYISVRRFFNMVEESVKKSTFPYVFENNVADTWVKVRGMIENYLTQKWREGALAGAVAKDAFYCRVGLGTTMTSDDILNGIMNVEIGMAVVRPAEFIVLKFSHKLQVS